MSKMAKFEHYELVNAEVQKRVDATATILGICDSGDIPCWLTEAYEALLDLGVSRGELDTARARAGI